jgi:hypothetical protein
MNILYTHTSSWLLLIILEQCIKCMKNTSIKAEKRLEMYFLNRFTACGLTNGWRIRYVRKKYILLTHVCWNHLSPGCIYYEKLTSCYYTVANMYKNLHSEHKHTNILIQKSKWIMSETFLCADYLHAVLVCDAIWTVCKIELEHQR